MKTFWIYKSMRKTSSVEETGTRTIFLEILGLLPTEQQIPTQPMALTLEMLEEKNTCRLVGHIYTDSSAEDAVRNVGSDMFVRMPTGHLATQMLKAENAQISKQKPQHTRMHLAYIAKMKPQKTVNFTDSKAALQSLTSNTSDQPIHQKLKDLQLLRQECTVALQWIPVHCGMPGNERADRLATSGSKQLVDLNLPGSQNPVPKQSKMP